MRFITITVEGDEATPERPKVSMVHEGISLYETMGILEGALHYARRVVEAAWEPQGEDEGLES